MGEPNRTNLSLEVGMSDGRRLEVGEEPSGICKRDLVRLRCRPREGPCSSMIAKAELISLAVAQKFTSSRYQALIQTSETYS